VEGDSRNDNSGSIGPLAPDDVLHVSQTAGGKGTVLASENWKVLTYIAVSGNYQAYTQDNVKSPLEIPSAYLLRNIGHIRWAV
jgi:hypothetical protein